MLGMTLASLGWGSWWVALFLIRFAPEWQPSLGTVSTISCVFAGLGLAVSLLTVRAQRTWLLFASVPLLANASLLCVPWVLRGLSIEIN